MSADARKAAAAPPPPAGAEEEQAIVPLDQADNDPPFGEFLGACNADADCSDGNTCNSFRKRGSHCTHPCYSELDCSGGPASRCTTKNRCGLNAPEKTNGD
jgi:hypothetical protein